MEPAIVPDFKVIRARGASLSDSTNKLEAAVNPLLVKGYTLVGGVTVVEPKTGDWTAIQSVFRKGSCTIN